MATFKTKTVHSGSGCYGGKNTAFALFTRVHKGGKLMVWPFQKNWVVENFIFRSFELDTSHWVLRMKEKKICFLWGHPKQIFSKNIQTNPTQISILGIKKIFESWF